MSLLRVDNISTKMKGNNDDRLHSRKRNKIAPKHTRTHTTQRTSTEIRLIKNENKPKWKHSFFIFFPLNLSFSAKLYETWNSLHISTQWKWSDEEIDGIIMLLIKLQRFCLIYSVHLQRNGRKLPIKSSVKILTMPKFPCSYSVSIFFLLDFIGLLFCFILTSRSRSAL